MPAMIDEAEAKKLCGGRWHSMKARFTAAARDGLLSKDAFLALVRAYEAELQALIDDPAPEACVLRHIRTCC